MNLFRLAGVVLVVGLAGAFVWSVAGPRTLPTLPGDRPGPNWTCAGVGLPDSIIHGDPETTDLVWLVRADPLSGMAGTRMAARWPHGFSARFTPELELLDQDGVVVAREGDLLTRVGGVDGSDHRLTIWDFNGHSYDCF